MHVNESKVNPNTFARSLKETGGYTVGMFGKYLNNMPSQATVGDGGVFVRTSAYDSAEHQRMASPPHPFSNSSLSPPFLDTACGNRNAAARQTARGFRPGLTPGWATAAATTSRRSSP